MSGWVPRNTPYSAAEIEAMRNRPIVKPTTEQIQQVLDSQHAVLRHMCEKDGVPVPDWATREPAQLVRDFVPVAPVLKASTALSLRVAKRNHSVKLNVSGAYCSDPKKCRVCSGLGITENHPIVNRAVKRNVITDPISSTSDAPPRESAPVRDYRRKESTSDKEKVFILNTPKEPAKPVPSPKIQKQTPTQIATQIEACRAALGSNATLVDQLVDAMAADNKTGLVAASRALRELWTPLAAAAAEMSVAEMAYGLGVAAAKGIPNANYVKKAAGSYVQRPATPLSQPRMSATTDDAYDRIFGSGGAA